MNKSFKIFAASFSKPFSQGERLRHLSATQTIMELALGYLFKIYFKTIYLFQVIPIYKSNEMSEKSNFRPISLLSLFTKVLEKIVNEQTTAYLKGNQISTS